MASTINYEVNCIYADCSIRDVGSDPFGGKIYSNSMSSLSAARFHWVMKYGSRTDIASFWSIGPDTAKIKVMHRVVVV